jgi:hypothetical protein
MSFQRLIDVVVYLLPGFVASGTLFFLVATRRRSGLERLALRVVLSFPVRWVLSGLDSAIQAVAGRRGIVLSWSFLESTESLHRP